MKKNIFVKSFFVSISLINFSAALYGQKHLEIGNKMYFSGKYKEAIDIYSIAINNQEEIAKAYMMRGASKSMLSDFFGAQSDLNNALKLDSLNYKIPFYIGRVYLMQGFYSSAIKYFDKSINIYSLDADVYDDRAIAKSKSEDYKGAILDEDAAIKIDSLKALYYTCRGWCKHQLKQYQGALNDYNISFRIQPDVQTYYNRGITYEALGLYQKAIIDFEYLINNISDCGPEVYYHRGTCYKNSNEMTKACRDFTKCIELGFKYAQKEKKETCGD